MINVLITIFLFMTLYIRKFFSYIEFFPGVYISEIFFGIFGFFIANKIIKSKKFSTLSKKKPFIYTLMIFFALCSLILALLKLGHNLLISDDYDNYKELGILLYPFYWLLFLVFFLSSGVEYIKKINSKSNLFFLFFPIYLFFFISIRYL